MMQGIAAKKPAQANTLCRQTQNWGLMEPLKLLYCVEKEKPTVSQSFFQSFQSFFNKERDGLLFKGTDLLATYLWLIFNWKHTIMNPFFHILGGLFSFLKLERLKVGEAVTFKTQAWNLSLLIHFSRNRSCSSFPNSLNKPSSVTFTLMGIGCCGKDAGASERPRVAVHHLFLVSLKTLWEFLFKPPPNWHPVWEEASGGQESLYQ